MLLTSLPSVSAMQTKLGKQTHAITVFVCTTPQRLILLCQDQLGSCFIIYRKSKAYLAGDVLTELMNAPIVSRLIKGLKWIQFEKTFLTLNYFSCGVNEIYYFLHHKFCEHRMVFFFELGL